MFADHAAICCATVEEYERAAFDYATRTRHGPRLQNHEFNLVGSNYEL